MQEWVVGFDFFFFLLSFFFGVTSRWDIGCEVLSLLQADQDGVFLVD